MGFLWVRRVAIAGIVSQVGLVAGIQAGLAVPPGEDTPEEVLRTEIILDARSPIDGKPMSPAAYAELQAAEQAPYRPPTEVPKKVKNLIGLLKIRKFIKTYLPFIPIK